MIQKFQFLKNVGQFKNTTGGASLGLDKLTLIYAENGRGKTTLAAVLRSLASGEALPVLERQRLGAEDPPYIVLNCEGSPSNVIFQNGAWNRTLPQLRVFDDIFVDENVYSGLDVEARHRQSLHELILGEQGVALNRRVQELLSRNDEHNDALTEKARLIPEQIRGDYPVDEFCRLPEVSDIDSKIEETEQALMAAQSQSAIRARDDFNTIEIPTLDFEGARAILLIDLPDLDEAAADQVAAHIESLGEGREPWVAEGVSSALSESGGVCPFCGQSVEGLELINHYRAYFSQSYSELKSNVAEMIAFIDDRHGSSAQVIFERAVGTARQTRQFWETYCELPSIEIETESVITDWNAARESVVTRLRNKQATPLERFEIGQEAMDSFITFNSHRTAIQTLNEQLAVANDQIRAIKEQAEAVNLEEISNELTRLKATKARYSNEIAPLCEDYMREKREKECTDAARAQARDALDHYRTSIFPAMQNGVNSYLRRFNAGFHLDSLEPTSIGGGSGSACSFNVVINNTPIAVRSANSPEGEPNFRNSLSAGDRNTLALAVFFSSLDEDPNLADTIIVIDDPISSLDDHRSQRTIQTIRRLSARVSQAIILSHNRRFLCRIWEEENGRDCTAIEIGPNGEESTIRRWDVRDEAKSEHDVRHGLLQDYAANQTGDLRTVAKAIRPHLEAYLRVACTGSYPPGQMLGPFIRGCRDKLGTQDEILGAETIQKLDDIREYGNRFQHDTNPDWETAQINSVELLGFVKDTLEFVGPPTE